MALERDLSTLLSLRSSLSSIFLEFMEAVCADLFPPAPYFFSCVVVSCYYVAFEEKCMCVSGDPSSITIKMRREEKMS